MNKKVILVVAGVVVVGAGASLVRLLPGETERVPDSGGMFGSDFKQARAASVLRESKGKAPADKEFRRNLGELLDLYVKGQNEGERWDELSKLVEEAIASDSNTAHRVCDQTDRLVDAKRVPLFGALMGASKDPHFIDELRSRVQHAKTPFARRAALLALEGQHSEIWWKPAFHAYRSDEDVTVRDEAADLLARHLADAKFRARHAHFRAELEKGLASEAATDRVRALRALSGDVTAGPEQNKVVEQRLKDDDPAVREAAANCLRARKERAEELKASGPPEGE